MRLVPQRFLTSGRVKCHYQVSILVTNQETEQVELMYRAPGRSNHQNLPEILDEIITRLEKVEQQLTNLENKG